MTHAPAATDAAGIPDDPGVDDVAMPAPDRAVRRAASEDWAATILGLVLLGLALLGVITKGMIP